MEEFAQLALDKPNEKELKSEETIKRHTVDPNIEKKPIERAVYLLSNGEEIQRLAVIQNLPVLLKFTENEQPIIIRILPKIMNSLQHGSAEFHIVTAETYYDIIEKRLITNKNITQCLLPMIKFGLDMKESFVAESWLITMLKCIEILPPDVIHAEIEKFVLKWADPSTPVNKRSMVPEMIGALANKYDKKLFLSLLEATGKVCRDPDKNIRAAMCRHLINIVNKVNPEDIKEKIAKPLLQLTMDEDFGVCLCAIEVSAQLLYLFNSNELNSKIIPVMRKLYDTNNFKKNSKDLERQLLIATNYGMVCNNCSSILPDQDKATLLHTYMHISRSGGSRSERDTMQAEKYVEIRARCALNFPDMLIFAINAGNRFDELLQNCFRELCTDPHMGVRKMMASKMDEISQLMARNAQLVKTEIIRMLKNESEDVLEPLVQVLASVLSNLKKMMAPTEMSNNEIGAAFAKCEMNVRNTLNWRLNCAILQQIEQFTPFFTSEYIFNTFVPIVYWHLFLDRPLPVRVQAGQSLLHILRYNMRQSQRNDMNVRLNIDLATSPNYYSRAIYIRLMRIASQMFSAKYFKEHYFLHLLRCSKDNVPNIRLMLVNMLPLLHSMLRSPGDSKLYMEYQRVSSFLKDDHDRDVKNCFQTLKEKINKPITPEVVPMDAESIRLLDEEKKLESSVNFQRGAAPYRGIAAQIPVPQRPRKGQSNARQVRTPSSVRPIGGQGRKSRSNSSGKSLPNLKK